MTKEETIRYIRDRYSAEPEYPWGDENYILRHEGNRKWFAVGLRVPYSRFGIREDGLADVLNVKCGPLLMDAYRKQPGVYPAYHMNKDHWVSILLDGSAAEALVKELLEIIFDLDKLRKKSRSRGGEKE